MAAVQIAVHPKKLGTRGVRHYVLDTETTGLDPKRDRIISIGAVEVIDGSIGQSYEWFFNPGDVPVAPEAEAIHGISMAFLKDKPPIKAHLADILGLLHESIVGGHNWDGFDDPFIEAELSRNNFPSLKNFVAGSFDTVKLARERWPGQRATLDAVCERVGISAKHRIKHGALIDAMLCAQVLLVMNREQISLLGDVDQSTREELILPVINANSMIVLKATADECREHDSYLIDMKADTQCTPLWLTDDAEDNISVETPLAA